MRSGNSSRHSGAFVSRSSAAMMEVSTFHSTSWAITGCDGVTSAAVTFCGRSAMPLNIISLSMAGYQLWSPWSPLDESLQWLRHTTPTPSSKHPFRASLCFSHTPYLEVQPCFQEVPPVLDSPCREAGVSPKLPCHTSELQTMNKKGLLRKPQPVRLSGVDSVFGRIITAQPPRWTGTFRVSEKSAFCKIISQEQKWPTGFKEPQIQMLMTMCKQMLRSMLLLYATYKKCTFALYHSK